MEFCSMIPSPVERRAGSRRMAASDCTTGSSAALELRGGAERRGDGADKGTSEQATAGASNRPASWRRLAGAGR
jgi:hypothetical protein